MNTYVKSIKNESFLTQRGGKANDINAFQSKIHMSPEGISKSVRKIELTIKHKLKINWMLLMYISISINYLPCLCSDEKLLVISLDGFRYDYYNYYAESIPSLATLVNNGVHAVNGVKTAFTPMTFPTHWTVATGLNQESHGIVANRFWDPVNKATFTKTSNDKFFYKGEPIWVTAKKAGKKTAIVMWVGSEVDYTPFNPDWFMKYNHDMPLERRVNTALSLLNSGTDFAMMYWHEPDAIAHKKGAFSLPLREKLQFISDKLKPIVSNATVGPLAKKLNIIILSDHGMTNITNKQTIVMSEIRDKAINIAKTLPDVLDEEQVKSIIDSFVISPNGIITHFHSDENQFNQFAQADFLRKLISLNDPKELQDALSRIKSQPKDSQDDQIYGSPLKFQNITYYLRSQIPKRWFYSNNDRIGHLVAVADEGSLLMIKKDVSTI